MAPSSPSSSSSPGWVYDVFPSFNGEDVRVTFLSHFLKELDRKMISTFRDNEMERSRSLDPELKQAIKDSRIAVVVFSKNYASSSWCLGELLEIVKCKEEFGQMVIPVFYGLDPSHVRKQTGDFGKTFKRTCQNKTEDEKIRWKGALADVANILGYHIVTWANEASMIEEIANDLLGKLNLSPSNDLADFVGIEDHIAEVSSLLHLESEEVSMVGIWGPSGIGKTTIARALFNRLSCQFQSSVFIDKVFISKSMEVYSRANLVDYNMKLHLQRTFLAEILDKKDIKIDHIGAMEKMLKHRNALIFIDDLDDQDVLDALAGQPQWFGKGSRIIVVTKDKHYLRAHGIDQIYKVCLPSKDLALEMFCRYAFRKNSPPDGFEELASEVALRAGNLPLGLNVLGSSLRGRDKEDWMDMLPRLRNGLDGKIEKTLKVSYDELNNKKDEAIFRHISCLFNGRKVNDIKLLLADSNLDVNIGLKKLVDKSLIHVRCNTVEMHSLLQEMGKEIVRTQSNEPGEREFLVDSKDICDVLEDNTGTKSVLGISLDIDKIDELHVHENAFKGMRNLRFLRIFGEEGRLHLPENFDYLPSKLKLLCWDEYPMRCMPSMFRPESLVKLIMWDSKLEKLWEGVVSLTCLKEMSLWGSHNLKEIPDLSMATNLEKLDLEDCYSLVELPSSIRNLNKLINLNMQYCICLENLPIGINLKSLWRFNLYECSRLRTFPEISTNICKLFLDGTAIEDFPSNLYFENLEFLHMRNPKSEKLWKGVQPLTPLMGMLSPSLTSLLLSDIPSLVELPSSFQNLHKLRELRITNCINLETLPTGINLEFLLQLDLGGCSRLSIFPDISTHISHLDLNHTAIEEVPWWIEKFYWLAFLRMSGCNKLEYVNLSKLKHLLLVDFSDCKALTGGSWNDNYVPMINFTNCYSMDQEALYQQKTYLNCQLRLSGEKVPSYFTHRTSGTSPSLTIPLLHCSLSQPFLRFRACILFNSGNMSRFDNGGDICLQFHFKGRFWNSFDSFGQPQDLWAGTEICTIWPTNMKGSRRYILEGRIPLSKDIAEMNYNHVDMQLLISDYSNCPPYVWGIRIFKDYLSAENRLDNPNKLPRVLKGDTDQSEDCGSSDIDGDTDQSEECGDSDYGDTRSETDQLKVCGDNDYSDIGTATDQSEVCGDNDYSDIDTETDQFEECGDSDDSDTGTETDQFEDCGLWGQ